MRLISLVVLLVFCCLWKVCIVQILRPQIANPGFATNNPTLTTIALEKPFCVFDGSMQKGTSYRVYLYVMAQSAGTAASPVGDGGSKPLDATFQQTNGGRNGPYKAAVFKVPNCASPPKLSDAADPARAPAVLTHLYLIRVGNDSSCLHDPDFLDVCNPPLFPNTTYRFKYVLVDRTAGIVKDQTLWSHPIKTKMLKKSSMIDTSPYQKSGGMLVIISMLSVQILLQVAGFLAALFLAKMRSTETLTETRYESQVTQQVVPRVREASEGATSPCC